MTMVETVRKRDPFKKALKLDALRKKQDAIKAKIAKLEAREKAAAQKEDTRLKLIVGAAILANVTHHPETRAGVVAVLDNAVAARRDRAFLKVRHWL
jgi:aminoglycoside phosphotransferase (APT) family kinase protein